VEGDRQLDRWFPLHAARTNIRHGDRIRATCCLAKGDALTGQEWDAVATGSVVVDGENLSVSARIETLEDRNLRTS
jgi:hypothetical protein